MLPRLILIAAVLYAIAVFVRRANAKPPAERRKYYLTMILSILAGAMVLLTLTGRVHWIGAAIVALMAFARQAFPHIVRLLPFIHHYHKTNSASRGTSDGNQSEVSSEWLTMVLDHDSGKLSGLVRKGQFTGRQLDQMSRDELRLLQLECGTDVESTDLLNSYLKHRFGEQEHQSGSQSSANSAGRMDRDQALAVLGLKEGASREDIIQAHRKLMQKLHPDRGGNDFLASQVNLAKDILLGN